MIEVKKQIKKLTSEFDFLECLETETIRTYTEKHESTRHISVTIGYNGHLRSIDIDPECIIISKIICNNARNVEWIESDSIQYLKHDKAKYHFVLLDSVNDPEHIFEEFKLVIKNIHLNGVLMIDDAGLDFDKRPLQKTGIHSPIKAIRVNEFLLKNNFKYEIKRGGHYGNQLFIKMCQENFDKIRELI